MNHEMIINDPGLRQCVRMMVYKCKECKSINIFPYNQNNITKCKECGMFLSDGMLLGDSHNADEYPGTAFIIDGVNDKNNPYVQVLFYTECRDCKKMNYIPYKWDNISRKNRLFYEDCPCHKKLANRPNNTVITVAPTATAITAPPVSRPVAEDDDEDVVVYAPPKRPPTEITITLTKEEVMAMKEYIFDEDIGYTKDDVVHEALVQFLTEKGYLKSR